MAAGRLSSGCLSSLKGGIGSGGGGIPAPLLDGDKDSVLVMTACKSVALKTELITDTPLSLPAADDPDKEDEEEEVKPKDTKSLSSNERRESERDNFSPIGTAEAEHGL